MAFDRMDWHYGGDYPKGLPNENGGTHIGMFLAWIIAHDLVGEMHREESKAALKQLLARKITGRDFLIEQCDEKLWADDFNEQGLAFAKDYYESDTAFAKEHNYYLQDYCDVFNAHAAANGFEYESTYHVENTWENVDKLTPILDKRYAQWQLWHSDPANFALDPKTQFLNACAKMAEKLTPLGFKVGQKGKLLKKTAQDKDLSFAITFEEDRYSSQTEVKMSVYCTIHSKKTKKWNIEQTKNQYDVGMVYYAYLKKLVGKNDVNWNVATKEVETSTNEIMAAIEQQFLPIFTLFEDSSKAADFLAENGTKFTAFSEIAFYPLAYLICMGYQKQAEQFLNVTISALPKPWQSNIFNLYKALPTTENIKLNMAEFAGAGDIKLAFVNGLKLTKV
jgi:Domain of unknown function (DUF4304)